MKRWLFPSALAGMALAGFAYPAFRKAKTAGPLPPQTQVSGDRWLSLTTPAEPTEAQTRALMRALANDLPLPAGYTVVEDQGRTNLVASGLRNPTQQTWQAIVTITEDLGDVAAARLFLNGVLKKTASYANGLVEDSGDLTVATMPVFLPDHGPYSVRIEWDVPGVRTISSRTIHF